MAVKFLEPGGDATFNVANTGSGFWGTIQGSPAVATDFVHGSHLKSIKYPTGGFHYVFAPTGVLSDTGSRVSFYVYFNAFPASGISNFFVVNDTGDTGRIYLRVTSSGVLQLINDVSVGLGGNGPTLSTGRWYRLCLAYTITSTSVNSLRVYVDGALSITANNVNVQTSSSRFVLGNLSSNALDLRTSDHYIDDSSSLADTGDIWVTAKRPNANGSSNGFTTQIGSGGSGYGTGNAPQVNERPISAVNGWSRSNTSVVVEEYSIEGKSTGDIDISTATIVDFMGWVSAAVDSTSNSPFHQIRVANVLTTITLTTSAAIYTAIAGSSTYPAGNTDIGLNAQFTTTPHTTSLYECGIVVAYTPGTGTSFKKFNPSFDGMGKFNYLD